MIRHIDLFSGIGGFGLAAQWAGMTTIGFCEVDPWCQRVLAKNFPGVPIHDDITTLDGRTIERWGGADVLTGGFPCQPYSVAGRQRGADDDRALWPEMRRVIAECRPCWVLGENTPGIDTLDLDRALTDLETEGYTAWAIGLPAVAVDAPHKRQRIWIVAHVDGSWESQPSRRVCEERGRTRDGGAKARTLPDRDGLGYGAPQDAVRTRGDAAVNGGRWAAEPGMARMVHGLSGGVDRRRGLGNAIVPQVAYEILRVMLETETTP